MAERKQGKGGNENTQRGQEFQKERRTQFSEVTFAALTGEASGTHLAVPGRYSGSTSGMYGEQGREWALRDLAEGGYVIDLRSLADNPHIFRWVVEAPMSNGRIEGNDIDRLSDTARQTAGEMAPFLGGDFQLLAALAATKFGEPQDGGAGMFDSVSAAYRALWWGEKGARIGRRVGDTLHWSDGTQQAINPISQEPLWPGGNLPQRKTSS